MQQLVGEKTPQTLKNIADFIGAEIDVELLNNSIFTQTVSSMVSRILPYYVSFTKKDGFEWEGRVGLVSNVQFINHTREAYCYTLIPRMLTTNFVANDDSSLHLIIVGKHQQKVLEYLRNNPNKLEELIDHFNIYYVSLQKRLKEMDVYNVSENDILEFFKENKEIYREFRGYIEYEVGIVRQYAPNIVQSWKYYQQFLQLHTE